MTASFTRKKETKEGLVFASSDLIEQALVLLSNSQENKIKEREESLPEYFKNSTIESNKNLPFFLRTRITEKKINKMVQEEIDSFGHHCFKDCVEKQTQLFKKEIEMMQKGVTVDQFNKVMKSLQRDVTVVYELFKESLKQL